MQKTLEYYNRNAREFAEGTSGVDFSGIQNRFLSHLPEGALILDFGCGSGRDTRYFLGKGFRVEAADGSEELCRLASVYTGIPVKQMLFQELEETEKYDGIWACASILHLRREELPEVFRKMYRALKPGGILYVSFKYGDFEGERNGRYFTDMTEETAEELLESVPELKIKERWVTGDVRAGRGAEKWLNMILRRSDTCWRYEKNITMRWIWKAFRG